MDIVQSITCTYIVVGRSVVALRPAALYSVHECLQLETLINLAKKTQATLPSGFFARWSKDYRKLQAIFTDIARLMTIENKTHCWSDRHLAKLIEAGSEILSTKKTTNGNNIADTGVNLAMLQKYYGGDQSKWYTMSIYQLIEYAEAVEKVEESKAGKNSASEDEFASSAHSIGMTGVYDATG